MKNILFVLTNSESRCCQFCVNNCIHREQLLTISLRWNFRSRPHIPHYKILLWMRIQTQFSNIGSLAKKIKMTDKKNGYWNYFPSINQCIFIFLLFSRNFYRLNLWIFIIAKFSRPRIYRNACARDAGLNRGRIFSRKNIE